MAEKSIVRGSDQYLNTSFIRRAVWWWNGGVMCSRRRPVRCIEVRFVFDANETVASIDLFERSPNMYSEAEATRRKYRAATLPAEPRG